MTQVVINIENDKLIPSLKRLLESVRGIISVQTIQKDSPYMVDPETGLHLKKNVIQEIEKVENGQAKTKSFHNVDDLIQDLVS